MNFLAHAFLSGSDDWILTGNLIADFVRGNPAGRYPEGVCRGIALHRRIDSFTDQHPLFRQSAKRVHSTYKRYSAVIMDVFYDHLLAINFGVFSPEQSLQSFVQDVDGAFQRVRCNLPELLHPRWGRVDWLCDYERRSGITQAFERIERRARRSVGLVDGMEILDREYRPLEADFLRFFPELIQQVEEWMLDLGEEGRSVRG